MSGDVVDRDRAATPRAAFADALRELWSHAGNPTLERVARLANQHVREVRGERAAGKRGGTITVQRISAWRRGDNIPAHFESLRPVVLALIDLARNADGRTGPLLTVRYWQNLWLDTAAWTPDTDTHCPYLGLAPYASTDADRFFGRARATAELADLVRRTAADGGGIVVLVGASGAGKSSLLAAGLVPALGADWHIERGTPSHYPSEPILDSVQPVPDSSQPTPESGRRRLVIVDQFEEWFARAEAGSGTSGEPAVPGESAGREELPQRLQRSAEAGATVVIGVRADFFSRCLEHPVLAEPCTRRSYVLGPMRGDELTDVVLEPARRAGLRTESGLVEVIIAELIGLGGPAGPEGAGNLPLLSHVLQQVWARRDGARLTLAGYREAGGVAGSVAATAEAAWQRLDDAEQAAARELLLAMVVVGQGTRDTRREVSRDELLSAATDPDATVTALEILAHARLITLDADRAALAHEVVIDVWPRLREWIDADRDGHLTRQRVTADAAEWVAADRSTALLYRGTRLARAREHRRGLATAADEFVSESVRARQRLLVVQAAVAIGLVVLLVAAFTGYVSSNAAHRQRDEQFFASVLTDADRLQNSDPTLSAELTALAHRMHPDDAGVASRLLSSQNLALAATFTDHRGAVLGAVYFDGGVLATAGDDHTIRLWSADTPTGMGSQAAVALPAGPVTALTGAGALLVSGGSDHLLRIHEVTDPKHPATVAKVDTGAPITHLALSTDGRTLAVGHAGEATLWDLTDHAAPKLLSTRIPLDGGLQSLAFTAHGHTLVTVTRKTIDTFASEDTVLAWDVGTGRNAEMARSPGYMKLTTTDDLVVLGDNTVQGVSGPVDSEIRFLRVDSSGQPQTVAPPLPVGSVFYLQGVALSADGTILATSTNSGTTLWNLADPAHPSVLGSPLAGSSVGCPADVQCTAVPTALRFSPDHRYLSILLTGSVIQQWELPGAVLAGQAGQIESLGNAISADGKRMVTLSPGADARIWDISDPEAARPIGRIDKPDVALISVPITGFPAISHDGRYVALILHGVMTLLDITDAANPVAVHQFPGVAAVTFDSMRSVLGALTPLPSPAMTLWDYSNPADPVRRGGPALADTSHHLSASGVQIAPVHGSELLTVLTDRLAVWDFSTLDGPHSPVGEVAADRADYSAMGLAAAPDRHTVVAGWEAGAIRVFDISDPKHIAPLGDPVAASSVSVSSVDISPDGGQLATGGTDATVRLWAFTDPARPVQEGLSITPPVSAVWHLAYRPGGGYLVGAGDNGCCGSGI
ncbi:nSTAND1 domain-containing NTPase [Nocardia heshunensis]